MHKTSYLVTKSEFKHPIRFFNCRQSDENNEYNYVGVTDQHLLSISLEPGLIVGETGIPGLNIDFNSGLRLDVPFGNWHIHISDADTEMVFFNEDIAETTLISVEKFYIAWVIKIWLNGNLVFFHKFDLTEQEVFVVCPNSLGDALCFLPTLQEFQRLHNCRLSCRVPKYMIDFVQHHYPELEIADKPKNNCYASYRLYIFMDMRHPLDCPVDGKLIPIPLLSRNLLGVPGLAAMPKFSATHGRQIKEPYVCIAVQASSVKKSWLYPGGWETVIAYLKSLGYRVLCIDRDAKTSGYGMEISIPPLAEDFTGPKSLDERLNLLAYADFFIGLSSGLSFLAYQADCPVIMICGFTADWVEFPTHYRVANRLVCNGCYNDITVSYHLHSCPFHQGTAQEFECQKKISPTQVIAAINRLRCERGLR